MDVKQSLGELDLRLTNKIGEHEKLIKELQGANVALLTRLDKLTEANSRLTQIVSDAKTDIETLKGNGQREQLSLLERLFGR